MLGDIWSPEPPARRKGVEALGVAVCALEDGVVFEKGSSIARRRQAMSAFDVERVRKTPPGT